MTVGVKSYERIIENLHDGLYFVDKNRVITYWNKAAERITGFSQKEVVGKPCSANILTHVDHEGNNLCKGMCPIAATLQDEKLREQELYLHHKNGHRVPVLVRVSTLTDDNGEIIGGIELFTDISNREATELRVKELEKMAMLDNLTQLANRNFLEREFKARFEELRRYEVPFGVLFMDIDHFKNFNDTHGHDVGDKVLKFIAASLVSTSRPFDIFGRWGGEEFVGIIKNVKKKELEIIAQRVRMLIEKSYLKTNGQKLHVTISIGATLAEAHDNMETVIKRADELLYKSKANGRNCLSLG